MTQKMIRKRDGRLVEFHTEKIRNAIWRSFLGVGQTGMEDVSDALARKVETMLELEGCEPEVEHVQDLVEQVLMQEGYGRTAKAYILYREERSRARQVNSSLMRKFEEITFKDAADSDIKRENANIDGDTAMGTILRYGSEAAKQFSESFLMKPEYATAHERGDIHIHDLDFYALTTTCCQIDLLSLFHGGFSTGLGHIREPQSIASYASLACIAIQSNQNDQHGGQSIVNFDYAMAEGVAKTYRACYRQNLSRALELLCGVTPTDAQLRGFAASLAEKGLTPALAGQKAYDDAEAAQLKAAFGCVEGDIRRAQEFAARRAAEEAERRRKEAIEADYRAIEHRRHMNEITFEEELAQLEALRQKHQLNAEEIMDWEEKVYDLKQEIRERDAESLDNLSDGVLTALENRYEAMLEAEQQRLDESRKTWEKWRDDSVAAIEDQIAALDKLADTEDREKQDAEELRKIAKLEQQIAYEQDDYNRAKLQQQLDQAVESREERLARLALEEQKEALRAEIEEIEKKADSQLEALDREQEAIEAAYEERMKDAALQAEAEKLILTQSQDELLSLISSYAPEYDALGQTLGEKLLDGFKEKVGEIAQWFDAFNARMLEVQQQMAQTAQSAADTFYDGRQTAQAAQSAAPAVTVNQTVEFNQPVETPAQVARRMEEVNEALALML